MHREKVDFKSREVNCLKECALALKKSNVKYLSVWANSNNCCRYLCFVYKLCIRVVQRIEMLGFLVYLLFLKRKKSRKNRNLGNLVIFIFCAYFKIV